MRKRQRKKNQKMFLESLKRAAKWIIEVKKAAIDKSGLANPKKLSRGRIPGSIA
jgi:hypothetical protein